MKTDGQNTHICNSDWVVWVEHWSFVYGSNSHTFHSSGVNQDSHERSLVGLYSIQVLLVEIWSLLKLESAVYGIMDLVLGSVFQ